MPFPHVISADQPRASAKVAILECFSTLGACIESWLRGLARQTTNSYQRVDGSRACRPTIAPSSAPGSQEVVRNNGIREALDSIEEHLMSEKFEPAPLDKHAEKPGKKDKLSDKAHGELEKGLEDSFPASDPPSSTSPRKTANDRD